MLVTLHVQAPPGPQYPEPVTWLRYPRVLGVVACVFFLVIAAALFAARWGDHEWTRTAARTDGTVTQLVPRPFLGSQREPRGSQVPLAPEVRYTVGGTGYTYTPAHGEVRKRYPVGSTVTVLYDPQDPETARLINEGRYGLTTLAVMFVLLSVGTAALLVATRAITFAGPRPRPDSRPPAPVGRQDDAKQGSS